MENTSASLEVFDDVVETFKHELEEVKKELARKMFRCFLEGCKKLEKGLFDEALEILKSVEGHAPFPNLFFCIGKAHYELGGYDQALVYFDKCITKGSKNPLCETEVALSYFHAGTIKLEKEPVDVEGAKKYLIEAFYLSNDEEQKESLAPIIENLR